MQLDFVAPTPDCNDLQVGTITRTRNSIRVDYALVLSSDVCIGTPPPSTPVTIPLGSFPPGDYTVSAFGTTPNQQTLPTAIAGFIVQSAAVPGPGSPALLMLAIALVLVAFRFRERVG